MPASMIMWRAFCASCCLLVLSETASAALQPPARQEVKALLSFVERSGCSFIRNGDAHDPKDARAHLQKKLEYLEGKGLVDSAEDFIDRAATQSSISGTAYTVDCAGQNQLAADWLKQELQRLRQP